MNKPEWPIGKIELAFDRWLSQVDEITIRRNSNVIPREWQVGVGGRIVCVTESSEGFSEAVARGLTQLWSQQLSDAVQPAKLGD